MGLPVSQRLRRTREIQAVRAHGNARESGFFRLQLWIHPEDSSLAPRRRLAVIASRRVGNAVARNRCKRLLRTAFRLQQEQLPSLCDVVLIARRPLVAADVHQVCKAFSKVIERLTTRRGPNQP